ncbi:MAG TPA: radical SAM family heme chaperone HemW [Usitatibacter sp.]|jgi:oxygen-independent coproporphyrinogen-3 oxidase|nr:radical SAM family heme chaperone HemW [Usitatibacter sp.]
MKLSQLPPLSLYVHLPWCIRKCPYCDFNSHERRGDLPEGEYVDALVADLEASLPDVWGRRLHTIFLGGGTPSLFAPESIERLVTAVRTRMKVDPGTEITMEANPGTFEMERFRGFRAAGVNRLSIGVQSFDDAKLVALGRVHGADEARRALEAALAIFPRVNADLMYALPGQRLEAAVADVREALARGVTHVSAYHLALEPDTHFARFPPQLPSDDESADMQEAIERELAGAGFEHYEISAFARPGERALHNVNYWTFGDYLGLGAGAHGKVSFRERITRTERTRKPVTYMREALANEANRAIRVVSDEELPFEFMLNALRLIGGFPAALFQERTGLAIQAVERELVEAEASGFIERDATHIRPTRRGERFLNDLTAIFLPGERAPRRTIPISTFPPGTARHS